MRLYSKVLGALLFVVAVSLTAPAQQTDNKHGDLRARAWLAVRIVLPGQPQGLGGVDVDIVPTDPEGDVRTLTTGPDGSATAYVLPGRYHVVTRPTLAGGSWWSWDIEVPVETSGRTVVLNEANRAVMPPEYYAQLDRAAPYVPGMRPRTIAPPPEVASLRQPVASQARPGDFVAAQPPAQAEAAMARPTVPQVPQPATAPQQQASVQAPRMPQSEQPPELPSDGRPVAHEHVVVTAPPANSAAAAATTTTSAGPAQAVQVASAAPSPAAAPMPPASVNPAVVREPAPVTAAATRPLALALLIDDSENMRRDAETVARALQQIQVPPGAESAVLHFQKRAVLDEPLSGGRTALAAPRLPPAKGSAALYDGVIAAANAVAGSAQRSKAVVVVSTGDDTGSHASARDVVAHTSAIPGLAVYGIVVGDGTRSNDLQDLARTTGGLVYSARDPQQVLLAYDAITRRVADRSAVPAYAAAPEIQPDRLHAMDFRRPLALYNALVVEPIPIVKGDETRDFPAGDDFILQRVLVARLKDSRTFPRVVSGTNAEARQAAADPNLRTVELVGTVVRYSKGSRWRRAMMGMGSTHINVRFVLRDLQSGQVLAVLDKEGSGSSGLITGGNAQEQETQALLQVVNGVVKDIQKNR